MRMLEETASPRGSGREEGWLRCATPLATSSPGLGHAARRSGCGPQQRSSIIDDDSLLRGRAPWIRDAGRRPNHARKWTVLPWSSRPGSIAIDHARYGASLLARRRYALDRQPTEYKIRIGWSIDSVRRRTTSSTPSPVSIVLGLRATRCCPIRPPGSP
jgi:hypothetical protein